MNYKSIVLGISALALSTSVNAASVALAEIQNFTLDPYVSGHSVQDGLADAFDGAHFLYDFGNLDVARTVSTLEDIRTYSVLDTFTNNTGFDFNGTLRYRSFSR